MMRKIAIGVALLGVFVAAGCSNSDETLAAQQKALEEKELENERLKSQLADQESVRLVEQRQQQQLSSELERLRNNPQPGSASTIVGKEPALVSRTEVVDKPVAKPAEALKISDPDIEVDTRPGGEVVLRLKGRNMFASGEDSLTSNGQRLVGKVAAILRENPGYRASVEGHTDDAPLVKTKDRWKTNENLSIARAISVKRELVAAGKVDDGRMNVVGFGGTRPLVEGKTESARARNRRVEVVLYK